MSPTVTVGEPKKVCPYCHKQGLPILPLRYAVARTDMGNAPDLDKPFTQDIELPSKPAKYTLRLLRAGYLYVFDERYGKRGWKGFQVDEGGYLYPFDPFAHPPSSTMEKQHFHCANPEINDDAGADDPYVARCFTVANADDAEGIWLAFSDVLWTDAVLEAHMDEDYRKAHMRHIDVRKVREGTQQAHAAQLENLGEHVAEYATTPQTEVEETTSYVKGYLPHPVTHVDQFVGNKTDEVEVAWQLLSPLIRNLTPSARGTILQKKGKLATAAWAFSGEGFFADGNTAGDMADWARKAAGGATDDGGLLPGMVAVDDPAGVAMELSGLIQQLTAEFTEQPERKWKHETALTIQQIKGYKQKEAVANAGIYASTEDEAETICERVQANAWEEYADMLEAPESSSGDEVTIVEQTLTDYQQAQSQHESDHALDKLEAGYLAWLQSDRFCHHFTHSYDRDNRHCGNVFAEVLGAVVGDLTNRPRIAEKLAAFLARDPSEPEHLFVRAMALNHDSLIAKWVDASGQQHDKFVQDSATAAITSMYAGWRSLMGGDASRYGGIAKYLYRTAGVLTDQLDMVSGELVMRSLPQKRLVTLLGALGKVDNPDATLADVKSDMNVWRRADILDNTLGKVMGKGSGGHERARARLPHHQQTTMAALVMVSEDKLPSGAIDADEMEHLIQRTAPRVGGTVNGAVGNVVGLFLSVATFESTLAEFKRSGGSALLRRLTDMFAQTTSLTGACFDTVASGMDFFSGTRMGAQFAVRSSGYMEIGEWLTGAGRLLGGFGAILGGVVSVWQGYVDYKRGHTTLGFWEGTLGILSVAAGITLMLGWALVPVLLLVVVFIVQVLIGLFKHDAIQNWLEKSRLGDGELPPFQGRSEQTLAFAELRRG